MGNQRKKVQKKKIEKKRMVLFCVIIIALLGVICLGYYLGSRDEKETQKENQSKPQTGKNQREMTDGELVDYEADGDIILGQYKDLEVIVTPTEEEIYQDILLECEDVKVDTPDAKIFQKGDYVCIDYSAYIDGEGDVVKEGTYACFRLGDYEFEDFPHNFENELMGAKLGEKSIIHVTMPPDYKDDKLANKHLVLAIQAISKFDDDYAKKLSKGKYPTMETLMEHTRKQLLKENKDMALESAWEEVIEKSSVTDYPAGSKKQAIEELNKQYENMADLQGITKEEFMASFGMDDTAIRKLAEETVEERMVAKTIAKKENLELTEEKYLAYLRAEMEIAEEDTFSVEELENDYRKNVSENVKDAMMIAMVKDFIGESLKQK